VKIYSDLSSYVGELDSAGRRQGFGTMRWADESCFAGRHCLVGFWAEDEACGYGLLTLASQANFEGQWRHSRACGFGVYQTEDCRFEGEWEDDRLHGNGFEFWKDGAYYIGGYVAGQRHGHATAVLGNGTKYEGQFEGGKACGFGRLRYPNGDLYEGHFRANMRYGQGRVMYSSGEVLEGDWIEDVLQADTPLITPSRFSPNKGFLIN